VASVVQVQYHCLSTLLLEMFPRMTISPLFSGKGCKVRFEEDFLNHYRIELSTYGGFPRQSTLTKESTWDFIDGEILDYVK
jgi:hypothetical protein